MTKTMDYYCDGVQDYSRKMMKKLSVYDVGVIKYVCFVFGMLFATWFPNFTKRCKTLFVVVGVILMVPVVIKAVNTFKEVFKYKWW